MELAPVAITSVLVAVAGPLGITLGWWLGRRGERERQLREERKAAYVEFVRAAIRFRNASDAERRTIREQRWAALAEIVLVAPPAVVEAASHQVAAGEQLLNSAVAAQDRPSIYRAMWDRNRTFTRLARLDLHVGDADPFERLEPILDDHIDFDTRTAT